MNPRLLLPAVLGLAAIASAPVATAAPKPPKLTKYTYKVELKGTQTSSWTLNHAGAGGCDPSQTGSGKETIRFSTKPAAVYVIDGLSQPFFMMGKGKATKVAGLKLRGTVSREGKLDTAPSDCPNGGGGTQVPPDCGTLKLQGLEVTPEYGYKNDLMTLNQADASGVPDFKNCPSGGSTFPYLLKEDESSKPIGQSLPYEDLFGQGKNIIIATGTYRYDEGELQYTNKIRWELSFTRIKVEEL